MIVIPSAIWDQAQATFRRNRRKVEQVCFLDGYRVGGLGIVTSLTFPKAENRRGYYHVSHEEVRRAARHLRLHSMVRLAQIHTHPTKWTGHSPYDDENVYSTAVGALSIVLPEYGRRICALDGAGIHLKTKTGWWEVPAAMRSEILTIVPSMVDLRGEP